MCPFLHRLLIAYACQGPCSAHAVRVGLRPPQPLFVTVCATHTFFVRWPGAFQIASSTCDVATSLDEQFDNFPLGHRRKTEHRQTNVQSQKKEQHKATPSYFFGAAPRVKITSGVPPEPPKGVYGGGRLRSPSGVHSAVAPNGGVSLWGSAPIPQVIRLIAECYSRQGDSLLRGGSCSSTIP